MYSSYLTEAILKNGRLSEFIRKAQEKEIYIGENWGEHTDNLHELIDRCVFDIREQTEKCPLKTQINEFEHVAEGMKLN